MSQEIYRKRHSKSKEHVDLLSFNYYLGKLTRNEVMKDSVEVEALNEALNRTDTPNTSKESQLARLYYRNGKNSS